MLTFPVRTFNTLANIKMSLTHTSFCFASSRATAAFVGPPLTLWLPALLSRASLISSPCTCSLCSPPSINVSSWAPNSAGAS